jgi:GNAT superfamily N-acetyltransferase
MIATMHSRQSATSGGGDELAERAHWERRFVFLRALGHEDWPRYADFRARIDPRRVNEPAHALLPKAVEVASGRASGDGLVIGALLDDDAGSLLGVARAVRQPGKDAARIMLVLRPDIEGRGLGRLLMGKLVNDCCALGFIELLGEARADNHPMIALARAYRFAVRASEIPGLLSLRLDLAEALASSRTTRAHATHSPLRVH